MSDGTDARAVATAVDNPLREQRVHQAAFGPRPKRDRTVPYVPPGIHPPGGFPVLPRPR